MNSAEMMSFNVTDADDADNFTTPETMMLMRPRERMWLLPFLVPKDVSVTAVIIGVFINASGLIGNVAIVGAIIISNRLRKAYNVCIGSLAVNDFLAVVLSHLFQMMTYGNRIWPFGYKLCVFHYHAFQQFNFSTILHILAITLYRYVVVMHPSLGRRVSTKSFVVGTVCVLHLTPFVVITLPRVNHMGNYMAVSKLALCLPGPDAPGIAPAYLFAATGCLVLVTLLFTHLSIHRLIKKTESRLQAGASGGVISAPKANNLKAARQKKHAKVLKCMLVVFILFAASYFPVVSIVMTMGLAADYFVMMTTMCLLWLSSGTNWIIYGVMDKDFREAYKKFFCLGRTERVGPMPSATVSGNQAPDSHRANGVSGVPVTLVTHM